MNESKATRYQRRRRRAQALGRAAAGAALALFALTPAGPRAWGLAVGLTAGLPPTLATGAALLVFASIIGAVCGLAVLPVRLYRASRVEAAYGRRAESLATSVAGGLVLMLLATLAGAVVLVSARLAGGLWWCLAAAVLAGGVVGGGRLGPRLVGRRALRPLGRPALEARISSLASRAGVPVSAVQQWVTGDAAAVATVTGVGASRRVLVAADVARDWSDDELTVVVAHELAHHAHHDLLRTMLLDTSVLAVGLLAGDLLLRIAGDLSGLSGAPEPAALPLVALVLGGVWLAATPLRHAQSRRQERRADRWALALTGQTDAFTRAVRRASARRLADEDPAPLTRWLYHRHPPVVERLELARRFGHDDPR